jgi:hypothetical protein
MVVRTLKPDRNTKTLNSSGAKKTELNPDGFNKACNCGYASHIPMTGNIGVFRLKILNFPFIFSMLCIFLCGAKY